MNYIIRRSRLSMRLLILMRRSFSFSREARSLSSFSLIGQVVRLADVLQLGALGGELRGFVFVAIHGMCSFQVAEK